MKEEFFVGFFHFQRSFFRNDLDVEVDDNVKFNDENLGKINWAPTINTTIPETMECPQEIDENLTSEQETLMRDIQELINETRVAALCCELVLFLNNLFYYKIVLFRILVMLFIGVYQFII